MPQSRGSHFGHFENLGAIFEPFWTFWKFWEPNWLPTYQKSFFMSKMAPKLNITPKIFACGANLCVNFTYASSCDDNFGLIFKNVTKFYGKFSGKFACGATWEPLLHVLLILRFVGSHFWFSSFFSNTMRIMYQIIKQGTSRACTVSLEQTS